MVNRIWRFLSLTLPSTILYNQERAISGGAIYKAFQTLPFGDVLLRGLITITFYAFIGFNNIEGCSVTTIPLAVTFRTCPAVPASTVYGRYEQWDMFCDEVDDMVQLLSGIFHMTRVLLGHRKMMRRKI